MSIQIWYQVPRLAGETNQAGYRRINSILLMDIQATPSKAWFDVSTPGYDWTDEQMADLNATRHEQEIPEVV